MAFSTLFRATAVSAAIGLLAGCSGASQVAPAPGQALQNHARAMAQIERALHGASPFAVRKDIFARIGSLSGVNPKFPRVTNPDAGKKVSKSWKPSVFVSDFEGGTSYEGAIYQYGPPSKKEKLIGTITDSLNPQGFDADAKENLYVTATGSFSINIYAPDHYTATSSLSDSGAFPVSVAVASDGTVYVANIYSSTYGPGNIEVYAPGSTSPTGTIPDSNIDSARFLAVDSSGILWYGYLNASSETSFASYDPSNGKVTEYGALGIAFPGGIRATKSGLAIADQYVGPELFHNPPQAGDPYQIASCGATLSDPVSFSFVKSDKQVFVADAGNLDVEVCPATTKGKELYSIGAGTLVLPIDAFVIPSGNT